MTAPIAQAAVGAAAGQATQPKRGNGSSRVRIPAGSKGPYAATIARKAVGPSKARRQRRGERQALVAEFVICALILGLSPLTDKHKQDTPGQVMKRATGIAALFVVLGLVASGGPRAGKAAAAFGGLVTLVLAVSDRDLFTVVAQRLAAAAPAGAAGPPDGGGGADGDFGVIPGGEAGPRRVNLGRELA